MLYQWVYTRPLYSIHKEKNIYLFIFIYFFICTYINYFFYFFYFYFLFCLKLKTFIYACNYKIFVQEKIKKKNVRGLN